MKRKRSEQEKKKEQEQDIKKKRKFELDEIKAKKILFREYLNNNPIELKRYSSYKRTMFGNSQIRYLIKKNFGKTHNINEENIKIIKKTLKEYVGFLVSKSKRLEKNKTVSLTALQNIIKNQIVNGDFLLVDDTK